MENLKQTIDLLGVSFEELRSRKRDRRLSDARAMMAASLPLSQGQAALLLNCTRQAVGKMRQRHTTLLACDPAYRKLWEKIQNLKTQKS